MFSVVATTDWHRLWDGKFALASLAGSLAVFGAGMILGRLRGLPVADHKRRLYFFESALTPNTFWVDLKDIDFSKETGKVMRLDLGPDQRNVFAGNTVKDFRPAEPFVFQGL